jgi:hypothetical protein
MERKPLHSDQLDAELLEAAEDSMQRRLVDHDPPELGLCHRTRGSERMECRDDVGADPAPDSERVFAAHPDLHGRCNRAIRYSPGGV